MAKNDVIQDLQKASFLKPVGSVDVSVSQSLEHNLRGTLSSDNPYLKSLESTYNKDQADWLLKQGLDFDASQQAMLTKAQLDYALLEDQREYDSPQERIARERIAGINPDVPGSGSSAGAGGSAPISGQNLSIPSNSSSTPAERESMRWQAASSMLGAFTQLGQAIVSAVDIFSTMPGRVALGEAQGQLATYQSNLIKQQTPAIVSKAQSESSSAFTDAAMKNLSLYDSMAQMFTSDSTDDEISSLLSTLGYGDDIIPRHLTNFRNFQKNPALQKLYTDNKLASKISAETAANYPIELAARVSQMQVQLDFDSKEFESAKIALQKRMAEALSNSTVIEDSVGLLSSQQMEQKAQSQFNIQQIEHDTNMFIRLIEEQARYFSYSERIEHNIRTLNGTLDPKSAASRTLTPDEQAIVDAERIRRLYVKSLASANLQEVYNLYKSTSRNLYNSRVYMFRGALVPEYTTDTRHHFENVTFDDFVNAHRQGDSNFGISLTKKLISAIPIVGDIASFIP